MKYLFGPVYSWRLGRSLGIDPISSEEKTCNMNCLYCQLGDTSSMSPERKVYVPTNDIIDEIKLLPDIKIDYLTFTSSGEPTLAKNLGDMIIELRKVRPERVAIITNSSLLYIDEVQRDLCLADFVLAKLDACNDETLSKVNGIMKSGSFARIVDGIKIFRKKYNGKLDLQIMFISDNKIYVKEIADIARDIAPDQVELNTPLRPSKVKPLGPEELVELKKYFSGMNVKTVYEAERKKLKPFNEKDTIKRHGFLDSK